MRGEVGGSGGGGGAERLVQFKCGRWASGGGVGVKGHTLGMEL